MPLQNRVDPLGNIHIVPEYGTCMGNRGILHNDQKTLVRYHRHKNWIICRLRVTNAAGNPINRTPMSTGQYTELFFLDEATALAAGHRPCGRCSRARYQQFVQFWRAGNPAESGKIDDVLHRERFKPYINTWRAKKRTFTAPLDDLPNGTFIILNPDPTAQPYLVQDDALLPWRFTGYGQPVERRRNADVIVLTPQSSVRTLQAGYQPQIFPDVYGE
jgi:hypothetical protein